MVGRAYNPALYRFGFNGKENDNEVKGVGDQQNYGMRIYDPRLGRFLSVDPLTKKYAELTPYQFSSNNPIENIDIDGLEGADAKKPAEEDYIHQQQYSAIDNTGTDNPLMEKPVIQKPDANTVPVKTQTVGPIDPTQDEAKKRQMVHKQFLAIQSGDENQRKLLDAKPVGIVEVGKFLTKNSKVDKVVGIGLTLIPIPGLEETGPFLYSLGEAQDKAGAGIDIVNKLACGDNKGAVKEAVKQGLSFGGGQEINSLTKDELQRQVGGMAFDWTIEKAAGPETPEAPKPTE